MASGRESSPVPSVTAGISPAIPADTRVKPGDNEALDASHLYDPLVGAPNPHRKLHPRLYLAEGIGTALLVALGLSIVILLFGASSPAEALLPSAALRRAAAGFLFGSVGGGIALSAIGRISGAHINPAVTLAFWIERKIAWRDAILYVVAQFVGAIAGAAPLLLWGAMGRSVNFGATLPERSLPLWAPLLGEAVCAFLLVMTIFVLAAHERTRRAVPFSMAPLFGLLVWLEAPLSGTSTNPARSLGPALVAGIWHGQWIYIVGPCLGAAAAAALLRFECFAAHRPREARLFHFRHAAPSP
jgi:aquaporin Z